MLSYIRSLSIPYTTSRHNMHHCLLSSCQRYLNVSVEGFIKMRPEIACVVDRTTHDHSRNRWPKSVGTGRIQGRIQEFWKGGADKGAKLRTEWQRRERRRGIWGPPTKNLEKLDAVSCNVAYILGIRMASNIIQNWAFAEQKTVAATISKPADIR